MKNDHVLIVEDEEDIASILKLNLEADGFLVDTLTSGDQVLPEVIKNPPAIILLDVMIPEMDGFDVCKALKANPETRHVPIIFLTAKTLEHNVISGLEIGADDYITKPFSVSVVISRIKAVLRRSEKKQKDGGDPEKLSLGGVSIDRIKMTVKTNGGKIPITTTEFLLLKHLIEKPGRVFKRAQLMDACKGVDNFVTDRSIDVLMVSIRKKMGAYAHLIETVRGVGYKFKDLEN